MAPRHLLSITDLGGSEIEELLSLTARMKKGGKALGGLMAGRTVALIFEKQSTRTRLAQEVACARLGARAITIAGSDLQIGRGETLEDSGRIFSLFVDAVCWRTTGQDRLERFASAATVPKEQMGRIMLAGPVISVLASLVFVPFIFLGGVYQVAASMSIMFNLIVGTYHLMPFTPMDGRSILKWNGVLWFVIFVPLVIAYFFLFMG